jgi:RNA polymerase sigma-B factor
VEGDDFDVRQDDRDEFLSLFARLPDDADARERLVVRFQPLAEFLARKFGGRGEEVDDLVQVANLGLLNAIDRFDPDRGVQFASYAGVTIVGELKRHFRDKTWAVRVPRRVQELVLAYHQALPILRQRLGRSPTIGEMSTHLDVSEEQVIEAIDAAGAYTAESLDSAAPVSGRSPADSLGGADPSMEIVERWADLAPAIRQLSDRDRTVLYLRFVRDLTQSEIAEEIGVSQMHVSRILTQSLEHLRTAVDGHHT